MTTGNQTIDGALHGLIQSINGALDVERSMRPGERQVWSFSNQSSDRIFNIALRGHRFRVVAVDGQSTVAAEEVEVLHIMPAGRVAVLVDAGEAGSYELLSMGAMTGQGADRRPDRVLGRLVVAGEPVASAAAEFMGGDTPAPQDLRKLPLDARRTVVFTQTNTIDPDRQQFFVDGKMFDAARVDVRVPLGHVEAWTIRNDTDDMHVFHIHQLAFQVVDVNGVAVPFNGYADTVRVPERGSVKVVIPFTNPLMVGRFMYHCHVLRHEDKGMMAQIEVFDPHHGRLAARLRILYLHIWWWLHGIPWSVCGLAEV